MKLYVPFFSSYFYLPFEMFLVFFYKLALCIRKYGTCVWACSYLENAFKYLVGVWSYKAMPSRLKYNQIWLPIYTLVKLRKTSTLQFESASDK